MTFVVWVGAGVVVVVVVVVGPSSPEVTLVKSYIREEGTLLSWYCFSKPVKILGCTIHLLYFFLLFSCCNLLFSPTSCPFAISMNNGSVRL